MTDSKKTTARRNLLKGAAVAAGAMSAPMVSRAQTVSLRFQSTWPAKDIFHEYANDFAKKVNDMASGRLKIEVLPSGSVVPAFQLLDAVNKGTLDGGHGVLAYHYGKSTALALWGSGPAFGMDPNMVLAWHNYGGGKQLLEEIYKSLNIDVVSYVYGPMPTQPLGWFKKPIAKVEDLKGLKYRTVGLGDAIVVLTDDANHAVSVAELGKYDPRTGWVTAQPYQIGVLLSSSNGITWTPHQTQDLTFRLLGCRFTQTSKTVSLGQYTVTNLSDVMALAGVELDGSAPAGEHDRAADADHGSGDCFAGAVARSRVARSAPRPWPPRAAGREPRSRRRSAA